MKGLIAVALFCVFALGSCASLKVQRNHESQLAEDVWQVSYDGGTGISPTQVNQGCLRHAAEVARANGFAYFEIIRENTYDPKLQSVRNMGVSDDSTMTSANSHSEYVAESNVKTMDIRGYKSKDESKNLYNVQIILGNADQ